MKNKNVILFGCGNWAHQAHLPAFNSTSSTKLVAIVDLEGRIKRLQIPSSLRNIRLYSMPDECDGRKDNSINQITHSLKNLEREINNDKLCLDGAIISTSGLAHYEYTQWALNRGLHTLVDKPLTITTDMAVDPSKSPIMVKQFEELTRIAQEKNVLFMLATQRRYNSLYSEIADEIVKAHKSIDKAVNSITSIQAFTSDGYHPLPQNFGFSSHGGKIRNTGYHVIDIVPWIMRHTGQIIDQAVIQASTICANELTELMNTTGEMISPSEIYAGIQTTFRTAGKTNCIFQFSAQHGGFSMKDRRTREEGYQGSFEEEDIIKAYYGRTKEEELRITQGPFFRLYCRRVAKIYDKPGTKLGERDHLYFEVSKNYQGINQGEEFSHKNLEYRDLDSAPTNEFLNALQLDKPTSAKVKSPVRDHAASIKLFAGIYESIAKVHRRDFSPVVINFNPFDWLFPAGRE